MTKKILKLGLIGILINLVFMGVVLAQQNEPNDCCKARATFKVTVNGVEHTIVSGVYIISDALYVQCDLDQDGNNDRLPTGSLIHKDWGFFCVLATIYLITNWLFIIIMSVVTIMIVYGGFLIVTAAGDPEKSGKGRKVVTYAVIGLAVALLARVIPSLVRFVIGM